jgi:hypothetical protein
MFQPDTQLVLSPRAEWQLRLLASAFINAAEDELLATELAKPGRAKPQAASSPTPQPRGNRGREGRNAAGSAHRGPPSGAPSVFCEPRLPAATASRGSPSTRARDAALPGSRPAVGVRRRGKEARPDSSPQTPPPGSQGTQELIKELTYDFSI